MSEKEIAKNLQQCLKMYAISPDDHELIAIITYASMLVGRVLK